jgi:Fur family peroxide stress response transcriptional regulator
MEIFREVAGTDEHPDAETIYQRVRGRVTGISRDTVYRTLATLEEFGLLSRTGVLGGPARFDANTEAHHHFVCTECGAIHDFRSEQLENLPIPQAVRGMGRVDSARVHVHGVCNACSREAR